MALTDFVTSTLQGGDKGGSSESGKGLGQTEWGKDGGGSGHDKAPVEHADQGGGKGGEHAGGPSYDHGGHAGGGNGGDQGEQSSSFDLTKIAKDLNVDSNVHYNEKNYNDSTKYEKEASQTDEGGKISKSSSESEDYGHKGESSSEHKYTNEDFGDSSHKSEDYAQNTTYNEKTFDYEFSLNKSFDSVEASHDSLLTGLG